ncbi:MAG TPA: ABC transporter substrate-binding protein [Aliidongia sp.]|uniref:ABC transporter substrate-binding protein n=1 Tax=Aliidongia sp. TaxID=1914230 RepID=UPI002DDDA89C|nr:ABC transporter substrate-binding protein [Aliidongia sp.]HEV2676128.1 ABC transporter substrate-binding protein [Aliidongia sp.]
MTDFSRRRILGAAATTAILSATGFPFPVLAQQGRTSITLAIGRDIQGLLTPPERIGPIEGNIIRTVCQGLIRFKPGSFEWELSAAKTLTQVSDTEISFELNPGLTFHGGYGEMTADDVKFSFELFAKPTADGKPAGYAKDWASLDHVEVTGKYTGKIMLKSAAPQLWLVVLPDNSGLIISKKAFEAGCYRSDQQPIKVIGTGAYTLAEWVPNQRVVLKANPDWKGEKPAFAEVVLQPVRDPKTAELALRANELQFTPVEPADAAEIEKEKDTKLLRQDSINYVWIGLNVEKPPFDNPKVRQALKLAIDVEQVLAGAYNGTVKPAYALMAPGLLGYWADAPKPKADPAAAKKLLAEAGHPNGFKCTLTLMSKPTYQAIGQIVQALLGEIGVQVDLQVLDAAAYYAVGKGDSGKNLDMALQRFGGKADPAFQTQWFVASQIGTWNWQRWNDPQFDDASAKAASINDKAERNRLYIEAQKRMEQSGAYIWLTHEANIFAFRPWLKPAVLPNGDDMLYDRFTTA